MKHTLISIKCFKTRGFTLLEIMIAILIITIGLVALANLQGKLTRYSVIAKQRTIAMNLAEQQIETMHSFYTMDDTGAAACSVSQSGYDDLESCADGLSLSVGNMQFDLSWTIVSYVQNADGTTEVYTTDSNVYRSDLKTVTINVAWADGQGETQNIELVDIIDATSIFNTGRVSARVDSNALPRVPFDPDDFPGVVEIALGGEKIKGSTTPKPEIINKGVNVITSFDVVTFLTVGENNAYLQRREEFEIVNCICTMDDGVGTGREPTVWDGTLYALGANVPKRTGSVSDNERGQPDRCEICCNDHHDAVGAVDRYDNFRPAFSGDAGTFEFLGDHAHYQIINGEKILTGEGDDYVEACRFIRKDGLFKLATDLSLENIDVVRATYPVSFNTSYSTSVISFITDFAEEIYIPDYPYIVPDISYTAPWWLNWWGIWLDYAAETEQAASRGIYIDYMGSDLLKKIQCLQADGSGIYSDYCDTFKDPPWLEIMPFFDIDATSLANWNRGSSAIEVTNSPISDIDRASFSRGDVSLSQSFFNDDTYVAASIERSNTGLTDTNAIDPDDENESGEDMPVTVFIGGSPPATGVYVIGDILAGSNKINVETVRVLLQDPPDTNCEIIAASAYRCDLYPTPVNGTVTFTDYNAVKVTNVITVLNRKVCTDNAAYSSIQVVDNGIMADPDLNIIGEHTVMTFSNLDVDTTINIIIVDEDDSCP